MRGITRTFPIILAAALQIMPLIRNLFINPATGSSFAFILRWGIGSAAALETVDAVSGATNYFTSPASFTGTVGVLFTNNLTILTSGSDPGAVTTITSNGVSAFLTANGQTTNFALPAGLTMKFVDKSPIYDAIYGTPTKIGTNSFTITLSYPGQQSVSTNITIRITAGGSPPSISSQPAGLTTVAGGNATFSVVAGPAPVSYQWIFNTNTPLSNATNASLILTNLRASQAGNYSVTITNGSGSINSFQAALVVTNPLPPIITSPATGGSGLFQFTFVPVAGLTNSVENSSVVTGGNWVVLTNIPPPTSTSPVTVTDPLGSSNRFYRVVVAP